MTTNQLVKDVMIYCIKEGNCGACIATSHVNHRHSRVMRKMSYVW